MDNRFTEKLGRWLEQDPAERDLQAGATMLLQLSNNKVLYNNILRAPAAMADVLEYQLQKFYNYRVANMTHEKVVEMQQEAAVINEKVEERQKVIGQGKRADHNELPAKIQALYKENLEILQRMRNVHERLVILTEQEEKLTCPDSERYPFLKELIELDQKYHKNWEKYDNYVKK